MKSPYVWISIIVILALILGIMNYQSWKRKKELATKGTVVNGTPIGGGTKPLVDNGIPVVEDMPIAELPSQAMEDLFGVTSNEDMASGDIDIVPISHTGVSMPANYYTPNA